MDYTITTINTAAGFTVELNASGNKRYIILENKANGNLFISKHYAWQNGEELFWKIARLVSENMHSWSDWVEMLEAA